MTMRIESLTLDDANRFTDEFGSSLNVVDICRFAIGTVDGAGDLHGIAVCTDTYNKKTLEIKYLCTDGWYNASFVLYEACCRFAKNMGFTKIITYTLISENGASLKASNFICEGEAGGTHWTGKRNKGQNIPHEKKKRWVKEL